MNIKSFMTTEALMILVIGLLTALVLEGLDLYHYAWLLAGDITARNHHQGWYLWVGRGLILLAATIIAGFFQLLFYAIMRLREGLR